MQLYGFWRSLATYRVRVALNLKGLAAAETMIDLDAGEQSAAPYARLNPQAAVPTLVLDDGALLTESLAIIEYLDETHPAPPLLPSDPRARAEARSIAQFVAADIHPLMVPRVQNYLTSPLGHTDAERLAWTQHWLATGSAALESRLAPTAGRYCLGDTLTIADLCLASHVIGSDRFHLDPTPYPTLRRIAATCLALPPFAAAHPLRQPGAPGHASA